LTLQPVIGQRKAAKSTVHVGGQHRSHGYVGGHSTADEGRELRRFDNVREDRGRGRGGPRKHGGLTVSGEAAAKQVNKAFKPKGPRQPGQRAPRGDRQPGAGHDAGNPAAFRTWYVPEGVETGPSGHRNPDGARGPRKPYGNKPAGAGRPGGPRPGGPGGQHPGPRGGAPGGPARGPGGGFGGQGERGPRGHGGGQGQRAPRPYGHPGNAPSFPSDHANPGSFNPYGDRPRNPRPAGAGPRPAGRPGGRPGGGPRPGGPRGGRPGGGGRGPQGGNR